MNASLNEKLRAVKWGEFKLGDLFEVVSYKKCFDANKVAIIENRGHPYIVRQSTENGRKGNIDEPIKYLNPGNTISFGQDTATMFYQERAKIKEAVAASGKQYDGIKEIIDMVRQIIPYNRMLISSDGYLIPLDDRYFRIDAQNLGFKYGGEITCVGMITNIIGEDTDPNDSQNIFATLQFSVNEVLRQLLPTKERNLCVIHPIAVYYGN